MKIVVNSYKDPALGLDWHEQTPIIEKEFSDALKEYDKELDFKLTEVNYGKGADWPTTEILLTYAPLAGIILPALFHKYIREIYEEYKIMFKNSKKLIDFISKKASVVSNPDVILLMESLEYLESNTEEANIKFIEYNKLHEIGSIECHPGLHAFHFANKNKKWIVSIKGTGEIYSFEESTSN